MNPVQHEHNPGPQSDRLLCETTPHGVHPATHEHTDHTAAPLVAQEQARSSSSALPQPNAATAAVTERSAAELEAQIIEMLRQVYDPEIPVNIYDLGLIYGIDVLPLGRIGIRMTLTSPACPVAGALPAEVEQCVRTVAGVTDAHVELVWDPPWSIDMMSEEAKVELNLF